MAVTPLLRAPPTVFQNSLISKLSGSLVSVLRVSLVVLSLDLFRLILPDLGVETFGANKHRWFVGPCFCMISF